MNNFIFANSNKSCTSPQEIFTFTEQELVPKTLISEDNNFIIVSSNKQLVLINNEKNKVFYLCKGENLFKEPETTNLNKLIEENGDKISSCYVANSYNGCFAMLITEKPGFQASNYRNYTTISYDGSKWFENNMVEFIRNRDFQYFSKSPSNADVTFKYPSTGKVSFIAVSNFTGTIGNNLFLLLGIFSYAPKLAGGMGNAIASSHCDKTNNYFILNSGSGNNSLIKVDESLIFQNIFYSVDKQLEENDYKNMECANGFLYLFSGVTIDKYNCGTLEKDKTININIENIKILSVKYFEKYKKMFVLYIQDKNADIFSLNIETEYIKKYNLNINIKETNIEDIDFNNWDSPAKLFSLNDKPWFYIFGKIYKGA